MRQVLKCKLKNEALSLVTDVTYAQVRHWFDSSYRDLKMSLIFPKQVEAHKELPVIVWLCGGAFVSMDRNVWLPQLTNLAQRGFVIASPEYRTSSDVSYPTSLQDVKSAIRYLRAKAENYCIDSKQVYIMGESAGGTLAILASVTNGDNQYDVGEYLGNSSDVQGVVDFYGLSDLRDIAGGAETSTLPGNLMNRCLNFFGENVEQASAVCHVDNSTPPTLIFHGSVDDVVIPDHSEKYYRKLQEAGVHSDLYILEGAGHGDALFYQDHIYDIIETFLKEI